MNNYELKVGIAAVLLLLGSLAGCSCDDDDEGGEQACTPGTAECLCDASDGCEDGLSCERGYCVSDECSRGTDGCACLDNGTCNAGAGGATLTCTNNICTPSNEPDPGSAGGACLAGNVCDGALECVNDICEDPGCPSGTTGCPCGAGGACDDGQATCNTDSVCEIAGCTPGTASCACDTGDTCEGALECVNSLCQTPNGLTATVDSADARACDVLLTDGARKINGVVFDGTVTGESIRQEPKLAVSFFARADEAMAGAFTVVLEGDDAGTAADVTIAESTCYDGTGAKIDGASVQLAN